MTDSEIVSKGEKRFLRSYYGEHEIVSIYLASAHPETPFPLPWREGIKGRGI
jgi:hypothetical protein